MIWSPSCCFLLYSFLKRTWSQGFSSHPMPRIKEWGSTAGRAGRSFIEGYLLLWNRRAKVLPHTLLRHSGFCVVSLASWAASTSGRCLQHLRQPLESWLGSSTKFLTHRGLRVSSEPPPDARPRKIEHKTDILILIWKGIFPYFPYPSIFLLSDRKLY